MSIENLDEHRKNRKKKRRQIQERGWLQSVYNPKLYRSEKKKEDHASGPNDRKSKTPLYVIVMLVIIGLGTVLHPILSKMGLLKDAKPAQQHDASHRR
jgi:hypothetical protein